MSHDNYNNNNILNLKKIKPHIIPYITINNLNTS